MHILISLPSEIAADIITKWITLKELLHVDTAYCSITQRPKYLDIVHCSHCVLPKILLQDVTKVKFEEWIRKEGIRSFYCEIRLETLKTDEEYLSRFGGYVGALKIKSIRKLFSQTTALVYNYCDKLKALECEDCLVDSSLSRLLSSLTALKVLRLDNLQRNPIESSDLLAISCPSIDCLYLTVRLMEDKSAESPLVAAFVRMCPNLTKCALLEFPLLEHLGVQVFTQHCCKLKRLSLITKSGHVQVSDGNLLSIAKYCPLLEHLDVSGSSELTDDGVFYASFHLPSLRSVCLADTCIGDSAVIGLARGCPHLSAAFLNGENHTISSLSINQLLLERPGITTLSLYFQDDELAFTGLNMTLMGNLTTLHLHRPPPGILEALPRFCPLLHTLYCTEMQSLGDFKDIVLFSSNLRYLGCSAVDIDELTQAFTQGLWQYLRPDVCFARDEYVHDALNFDV